MPEKRIDAEDGAAYTWDELSAYYQGKYKKNEIAAYWDGCKPVKGKKGAAAKGADKACTVCGKTNHTKADCKFRDKECTLCGKVGHLQAVCRSAGGGSGPKSHAKAKVKAKAKAKDTKPRDDRGRGCGRLYDDITATIGNTPCVKISDKMTPAGRTIYAKCEFFNPLGSVKDRLAIAIIEDAEKKGLIKPGDTLVEATSGNTGIAIAMVCAQRGYKCVVTMAEPFSIERRKLMRFLGAQVIITPKKDKGSGMVNKAKELAEANGWYWCRQFENEANPNFHERTTGREIVNDFKGKRLDYFCSGYGTGGTYAGACKAIKAKRPDVKLCLGEPAPAGLLASKTPQERLPDGSPAGSHPAFTSHPIQGWTPDFIPKIVEDGVAAHPYDEYISIPPDAAMETSKQLAQTQGIFTGISGGASVYIAIEVAKKAPEGSVLVAMVPDTGERYLSTPLFGSIEADMNAEEVAISKSTPGYQLS